jgi:dTDP-glucose 4,6-dehydratase
MTLPAEDLAHVVRHMRSWEKLRGKRIFLTGASGFVGTWLTQSFECANESLQLGAALIRISRTALPPGQFDYGIHAARADGVDADIDLTRQALEFAVERGADRFLFTSSGAVHGQLSTGYAQAKRASEFLCAAYAGQFGFCAVIARLFTFLGPGLPLDKNFAVGNFIRDVLAGGDVIIQGDGTPRRSYLYAADLAVWLWTLLLEGESARPYNLGSTDAISIYALARAVVTNTKPGTQIVMLARETSPDYIPSFDREVHALGLRSLIPLQEGIRRMYAWNVCQKERENKAVRPTA